MCNHDWVDYDSNLLNNIEKERISLHEKQMRRIVINRMNMNELDKKLLKMLVTWTPPDSQVKGKCMVCDREVIVTYININNHMAGY